MKRLLTVGMCAVLLLGCALTPKQGDTEAQKQLRAVQRVTAARLSVALVYEALIPFVEEGYFDENNLNAMLLIQQNIDNGLNKAEEVALTDASAFEGVFQLVEKALSDLKTYLIAAQAEKGESE